PQLGSEIRKSTRSRAEVIAQRLQARDKSDLITADRHQKAVPVGMLIDIVGQVSRGVHECVLGMRGETRCPEAVRHRRDSRNPYRAPPEDSTRSGLLTELACSHGDDQEAEDGHQGEVPWLRMILIRHEKDVAAGRQNARAKDGITHQFSCPSRALAKEAAGK